MGTHVGSASRERRDRHKRRRRRGGKSPLQARGVKWTEIQVGKGMGHVPGKAAIEQPAPVPQTDTGGWGENPKAGGRSIAKELGKTAP